MKSLKPDQERQRGPEVESYHNGANVSFFSEHFLVSELEGWTSNDAKQTKLTEYSSRVSKMSAYIFLNI